MLAMGGLLGVAASGLDPFWRVEPLTLSEAAALRDDGEAAWLILEGHDPNTRYPVREDLIDGRKHVITPLEAAVRSRRLTMVELLVSHGARPDIDTWTLLVCAPQDNDIVEVRSALEGVGGEPASVLCKAGPE